MATLNKRKNAITTDNEQSNITTTKPKWNIKKKVIATISVIVLFIITLTVAANLATSAPLKVSDEFISGIQTNNSPAAYRLMSADAQIATSSQEFSAMVDQIGPVLTGVPNNTSKEVSTKTNSDPTAKIVYEVKGNDGYTHILTVNLVQKNDKWQVLNFESVKK